jgi:D-alanyl-lipoteichoic acid acyltransferase DltB (MBOAT superfamily)
MLFNSIEFFIFFILVFSAYLLLDHRWQNRWLVAASLFFYGWWDWRFLGLILFATTVDYFCAILMEDAVCPARKRRFMLLSIGSNLTILGFFKYFNFFAGNLVAAVNSLGLDWQPSLLHIILPVGVSFFTFQSLSYTIDVYRGQIKASRRFTDFALFVTFFPQLLAGPIGRAGQLLPQICHPRQCTGPRFYQGCFLVFWGLFEKIFLAGNFAKIADPVFNAPAPYHPEEVLIALYAFAFQIFCDFDAYSNIARGLAQCMGFDLAVNFNLPYWASNPKEFWQRWHISLSTWLRDYLYIPLGGNHGGAWRTCRNLFVTMLLGGLWHGASWTFVCWGDGCCSVPAAWSRPGKWCQRSRRRLTVRLSARVCCGLD